MRKTIYVSSESQWEEVVVKSAAMGLSVSQYLLGGKHIPGDGYYACGGQLDRIESKLDNLLLGSTEAVTFYDEDAKRKNRNIKKDKIAQTKKYFNPQPKKGKK